jgi:hypothetical protein
MEKTKPLIVDKIDQQRSSIISSLEAKADELKMIISAHEALRKEIESKTQELANMKAEMRQGDRLKLLKERLCTTYEAQMLAEIIDKTLELTLHEQKNRGLTGLYEWISHFWNKFRPESKWGITLDENGIIRVGSKERQYVFSHLSGGEKTVLLVLVRFMLCRFLATKLDFIMIDEPLEHLDIRNRRSLLNFLVGACRKNIIPQMFITTFEETLIRKYYEGEKTRTELLA